MDTKITNKIVKIENIIEITDVLEKRLVHYKEKEKEEEQKYNEAKANNDYYSKKYVDARISYSITYLNNETIKKTNENFWFVETLSSRRSEIKEIDIYFYASDDDQNENINISLTTKSIYLSSTAKDMQNNELAHIVENYFNSLPVRYDELVVKNKPRKFIPSLAIAVIAGIVGSLVFFLLTKLNVISFENGIYGKIISAGILVVLTILGGLGFPNQNIKLYKNIKFEKYYAGHDDDYNSIYKDDVATYKQECEICFGKNTDMPNIRAKIESNYKKSKNMVLIESLLAVVLLVIFFLV